MHLGSKNIDVLSVVNVASIEFDILKSNLLKMSLTVWGIFKPGSIFVLCHIKHHNLLCIHALFKQMLKVATNYIFKF